MSGFNNPIIGGGGGLVYPSIHSPNFVTGSAGWTINKDGSAEFNNVVIRNGQVVSGTILIYSSLPPALGNLVASIAASTGTDTPGNAYLAGFTSYVNQAGTFVASQVNAGQFSIYTAPGAGGPWTLGPSMLDNAGQLLLQAASGSNVLMNQLLKASGGINITAGGLIVGGGETVDTISVSNLIKLLNIATPSAAAGAAELYGASGQPAYVNPAGLQMNLPGAQLAAFPVKTVTQTILTDLANGVTVPANDAEVGAVYELEVWGNGVQGSTLETLEFAVEFGGNTMSNFTIGSTAWAVTSQAFRWRFAARVICITTGAAGTWSSLISGEVSAFNANLIPSNSSNVTGGFMSCESTGTTTVDTTAAQVLNLRAAWGATTGGPTLTSRVQLFKRIA